MQVPFVDLALQYNAIEQEVMAGIAATLRRADFIMGQNVTLFEEEFASYCEVNHAVGVDSGLSALELLIRAYGIGTGDEVITAANAFIGTILAIMHAGAKPVLVDIDPHTYMLDPEQVQQAITQRTKAIVPVHLYGHPAEMNSIMELSYRYGLTVIEEASQAHGARYKGQRIGSIGHASAFDLYPSGNLGAYGDAGIVVTDDGQIAQKVRMLRNYGQLRPDTYKVPGYSRRMDTVQASILRVKLRYLDEWNAARRRNANLYNQLLANSGFTVPAKSLYAEPVYHLYVIQLDERYRIRKQLASRQISTMIHYPEPAYLQNACHSLGYEEGAFPITERCARRILSLPMYPELTMRQIEHTVDELIAASTEEVLLNVVM